MLDRLLRMCLVIGGVSCACAVTWPGRFPVDDPLAILVHFHTPNFSQAAVAWYYVAPGVAVYLAGMLVVSTSRIWFARAGIRFGLRARLPDWPLSPTSDGPSARDAIRQSRSRDPCHGCSTASLRHRRMKRLASAGFVRPMKARYWERKNTPLCRQTSASHSASRRVQPCVIRVVV